MLLPQRLPLVNQQLLRLLVLVLVNRLIIGGAPATSTGFGSTFNKPATGFGQQPATTTFGQPATGFGQQPSTGFNTFGGAASGTETNDLNNNGTGTPSYTTTQERDPSSSVMTTFLSISGMPAYKKWSVEVVVLTIGIAMS